VHNEGCRNDFAPSVEPRILSVCKHRIPIGSRELYQKSLPPPPIEKISTLVEYYDGKALCTRQGVVALQNRTVALHTEVDTLGYLPDMDTWKRLRTTLGGNSTTE
jgi:hypothetical protein